MRRMAVLIAVALLLVAAAPAQALVGFDITDFTGMEGDFTFDNTGGGFVGITTNGVLRVTDATGSNNAIAFRNAGEELTDGFTCTFTFDFTDFGPNQGADGMAFVVANAIPVAGGFNGEYGPDSNSLNVAFRSYSDNHIRVSGGGTTYADLALPSGPFPANLSGSGPHRVRVDYHPNDLDLTVDGVKVFSNVNVDLAALGAVGGGDMSYLGFTARTGGEWENHDVTAWSLGPPTPQMDWDGGIGEWATDNWSPDYEDPDGVMHLWPDADIAAVINTFSDDRVEVVGSQAADELSVIAGDVTVMGTPGAPGNALNVVNYVSFAADTTLKIDNHGAFSAGSGTIADLYVGGQNATIGATSGPLSTTVLRDTTFTPAVITKTGDGTLVTDNSAGTGVQVHAGTQFRIIGGTLRAEGGMSSFGTRYEPLGASTQPVVLDGGWLSVIQGTVSDVPDENVLAEFWYAGSWDENAQLGLPAGTSIDTGSGFLTMTPDVTRALDTRLLYADEEFSERAKGIFDNTWVDPNNVGGAWSGYMTLAEDNSVYFGHSCDDRCVVWFDLDSSGTFEHSNADGEDEMIRVSTAGDAYVGDTYREIVQVEVAPGVFVDVEIPKVIPAGTYKWAAGFMEWGGGEDVLVKYNIGIEGSLSDADFAQKNWVAALAINPGDPGQAGIWSSPDATEPDALYWDTPIDVSGPGSGFDSADPWIKPATIETVRMTANGADFGTRISGRSTEMIINNVEVQSGVGSVGLSPEAKTTVRQLTVPGTPVTIAANGPSDLVFDQESTPALGSNVTFNVTGGRLIDVLGSNPLGTANVNLTSGTFRVEGPPGEVSGLTEWWFAPDDAGGRQAGGTPNGLGTGYHTRVAPAFAGAGLMLDTPDMEMLLTGRLDYKDQGARAGATHFSDRTGGIFRNTYYDPDDILGLWTGEIVVGGDGVAPGDITFATRTDDGSSVAVNTSLDPNNPNWVMVLDNLNNGGTPWHGEVTRLGTINLPNPGQYQVAITFMEGGGGGAIQARFAEGAIGPFPTDENPGEFWAMQVIDPSAQPDVWKTTGPVGFAIGNAIKVLGDSRVEAHTTGVGSFDSLVLKTGTVEVEATLPGGAVVFENTSVAADAPDPAQVGVRALSDVVLTGTSGVNGNSKNATIGIEGPAAVILNQDATGAAGTVFEIQPGGRLRLENAVAGSDLTGPNPVKVLGGSILEVAPSAGVPPAADLVAYWGMNEAAGARVAADETGVYPALLYGGTDFTAGVRGNGMSFNGTDGFAIAGPGLDDFSTGITVSGWVKVTAFTNWARMVGFGNAADVDNIILARRGTSDDLRWEIKDPNYTHDENDNYPLNEWIHIAAVIDGKLDSDVYINGTNIGHRYRFDLPGNVIRSTNFIGESHWTGDAFFQGLMDELSVYRRGLSQAEVQTIYQQASAPMYSTDAVDASSVNVDVNPTSGPAAMATVANESFKHAKLGTATIHDGTLVTTGPSGGLSFSGTELSTDAATGSVAFKTRTPTTLTRDSGLDGNLRTVDARKRGYSDLILDKPGTETSGVTWLVEQGRLLSVRNATADDALDNRPVILTGGTFGVQAETLPADGFFVSRFGIAHDNGVSEQRLNDLEGMLAATPTGLGTAKYNGIMDINDDGEFQAIIPGHWDRYTYVFTTMFNVPETYADGDTFTIAKGDTDDRGVLYFDEDDDGIFQADEKPANAQWGGMSRTFTVRTTPTAAQEVAPGEDYKVAFVNMEWGGGSNTINYFTPPGGSQVVVNPSDPAQALLWRGADDQDSELFQPIQMGNPLVVANDILVDNPPDGAFNVFRYDYADDAHLNDIDANMIGNEDASGVFRGRMVFRNDGDFQAIMGGPVDDYMYLFETVFTAMETGRYGFRRGEDDDVGVLYLDTNDNGVYEAGEKIGNGQWGPQDVYLDMVAGDTLGMMVGHREGGGGSTMGFAVQHPDGIWEMADGRAMSQRGMWTAPGAALVYSTDSTLELITDSTAVVNNLTLKTGGLVIEGAPGGATVGTALVHADAISPLRINTQTDTLLTGATGFDVNETAVTIQKQGGEDLILDKDGLGMAGATLAIQQGRVIARVATGLSTDAGSHPLGDPTTGGDMPIRLEGGGLRIENQDITVVGTTLNESAWNLSTLEIDTSVDPYTIVDTVLDPLLGITVALDGSIAEVPGLLGSLNDSDPDPDYVGALQNELNYGTGEMPAVTGVPASGDEFYVMLWHGMVNIPPALDGATFTVGTESDDGSAMWINIDGTWELIVNNEGLHGGVVVTEDVTLAAGSYETALAFYEWGGGDVMRARVGIGGGLPWGNLWTLNPWDPDQAGLWSGADLMGIGSIDWRAGNPMTLLGNSVLDAPTDGDAQFDVLQFVNGMLTTTGARRGISFETPSVEADGTFGLTTQVVTTLKDLNGNSHNATLVKDGGDVLLMVGNATDTGALTYDVQQGQLVALGASNPLGEDATIRVNGGEAVLASAKTSAPLDVAFNNSVIGESGTLTAGTGGHGTPGPLTVALGGPDNGVTVNGSLNVRTTDQYTLDIQGDVGGAGALTMTEGEVVVSQSPVAVARINVQDGSIELAQGGNVGKVMSTGGEMVLGSDLTVDNGVVMGAGVVNTGASVVNVNNSLALEETSFSIAGGGLTAAGANLLAEANLVLSGVDAQLTVAGPPGGFPAGPIGRWTFDNLSADDSSGNFYDGVKVGGFFDAGDTAFANSAGSVNLTGGDNYVVVDTGGNQDVFDLDTLSVAFWVKGWADGSWEPFVSKGGESGQGWQVRRYSDQSILTFTLRGHGNDDPAGTTTEIADNPDDWHLVVATYDATNGPRNWYVNGVEDYTNAETGGINDTISRLVFGARDVDGWNGATGLQLEGWSRVQLDDIYIYDRALSQAEVDVLYGAGAGPPDVPGVVQRPNAHITANENATIYLRTLATVDEQPQLGDLNMAAGVTVTLDGIDGASISFADVNGGHGSVLNATGIPLEIRGNINPDGSRATLTLVGGEMETADGSSYTAELNDAANGGESDLLTIEGVLWLGDTNLALSALNGYLAGDLLSGWGDKPDITVMNAGTVDSEIVGEFVNYPPGANVTTPGETEPVHPHLGHGVFLGKRYVEDDPVNTGEGVLYTVENDVLVRVDVHVWQGAPGDANGDRKVDFDDIWQIVSSGQYDQGPGPMVNWTTGNFNGDDNVDFDDIWAIVQTGLYDQPPYAATTPGGPDDGEVTIFYNPADGNIFVETNQRDDITGIKMLSAAGIFTAQSIEDVNFHPAAMFKRAIPTEVSGAGFGAFFTGDRDYGNIAEAGHNWDFLLEDLTLLYTVTGVPGNQEATLFVIPEPGTLVMLASGLLGLVLLVIRRRRRAA